MSVALVFVVGCSVTHSSPSYPNSMNVTVLSDGGVCFDAESAKRLAELRAELEKL